MRGIKTDGADRREATAPHRLPSLLTVQVYSIEVMVI